MRPEQERLVTRHYSTVMEHGVDTDNQLMWTLFSANSRFLQPLLDHSLINRKYTNLYIQQECKDY